MAVDTLPPLYRFNPCSYIMDKPSLPITGNATAKFGQTPLHNVYGDETRRFNLMWTTPAMGTLYISDVTIDLDPLAKGDYTLAFDLFLHPSTTSPSSPL